MPGFGDVDALDDYLGGALSEAAGILWPKGDASEVHSAKLFELFRDIDHWREAHRKQYMQLYRAAHREHLARVNKAWQQSPKGKKSKKAYTQQIVYEYSVRQWANAITRKYGLSREDYEALLVAQNFRCAICETPRDDLDHLLHVDHDHETGKVRGLLCRSCNTGLGCFQDNPAIAERAVAYLEAAQCPAMASAI